MPYAVARQFATMSTQLAVALPPFDISGFDLKLHWHRRFDNEPRNKWLREQLVSVFKDDLTVTVPPGPILRRGRIRLSNSHYPA